jgi:5-methyltetrahydrofolate--homocysteine methyltransferase
MWERLRDRKLDGANFRCQGRIGPYVVDFVCLESKLIVEIDGRLHELPGRREKDAVRQRWLESEGFRIVRFTGMECHHDIDRVLSSITAALRGDGPSPPPPRPQGERGE